MNQKPDIPDSPTTCREPRRAVAEMTELAGGLAHELRNPLSTMMINLKLLAEDLQDLATHPEDARRRGLLKIDVLRREAERLQSLFDDFLNLTGPWRLQRSQVDINAVVARLVEFFEPLANSKRITVEIDTSDGQLLCPVDEKLLGQALLNIVINAQQAMPEGGVLRIVTGVEDDEVTVAISDTGVGIAEEDRERILRPFFSTTQGGNGLGLSITLRIVHEHGGTLGLESELGRGTAFLIRLPRRVPDTATERENG